MSGELSKIQAALAVIPSDDRDTWLQIGMAINSELGEEGFHLWDSWSRSASSYNENDARASWKSFTPGGGINISTLFHYAQQNGWSGKGYPVLTDTQKARYRANLEAERSQREDEQARVHAECRIKASRIWKQSRPAQEDQPYLERKGIKANGLRQYKDALVVPVRDSGGTLHGLQFIDQDGGKNFLTGTVKAGHYHSIGGKPETVLCLAEGYATAATIHEATGQPVAVCFDAGNLKPVAEVLREKFPDIKIVICADNDTGTKGNPGLSKATEAANTVSGLLAAPEFPAGTNGSDFNDLAAAVGLDEVRRQIESAKEPKTLAADRESLPLRRPLPKSEPFPIDALPTLLRGMVERIIETIQSPVALASQSVLAAASLAVQSLADVSIDGRKSPLSSFFITIGESGERKSATDNVVLAPHRKHERTLIEKAAADQIDYQASLEEWKKAKEQAAKEKENIKHHLMALGAEPFPPLGGQIITEEPTYEGIFKLLETGRPSIGIFSAEGGRFIGGHAMGKDNQLKTATGLSSLWDGSPMTRTRGGDGSGVLYGRRCSLHLMLQPNIASDLFSNQLLIGQGLLSRCLATYPESTIGRRMYREADLSQSVEGSAYFTVMMQLFEYPQPMAEGKLNELAPKELYLAPAAKGKWIGFHDHIEGLMQEGRELSPIKGFAAKAAEHAARLAGIITLVSDPAATSISTQNIEAGIELSQFYIGESLRLFHSSTDDQELILAESCLEWASSQGGLFSLPCLYQKGPNRVRDRKTAKRIIEILEQHNRIEPIAGGAEIDGKNRREVWRVAV
ncbi:DUF3987 domain-containing protein [Pelovirga terrestris]|uniref:DUF3987 domain-containing protein n=1 Tax=Pelovirga terrestris TaxID=2771352 RepID=A0A8J6UHK1_9BACT|nr:DUF3987 domain-containing protein [Pelovirga terrestris]MBD1399435.1 DUF3987 domain-containing protein [Pelovirga terrestris]